MTDPEPTRVPPGNIDEPLMIAFQGSAVVDRRPCFTCLDTGRVPVQTGLDTFTSAPCPDCRPSTSGDAA